MLDLIKQLTPWRKGEPVRASKLNEPVQALNRTAGEVAGPRRRQSQSKVSRVQRFKVASISNDYLTCNPYTPAGLDTSLSIKVAKPWLLRASMASRDGIDFTYASQAQRTADDGSNTETQVVVPSYVVGDQLFAVRMPTGGTGVDGVEWQDLNHDARKWARKQP